MISAEGFREWVGVIGGGIAIVSVIAKWGYPMYASFCPMRIVPLGDAYTVKGNTKHKATISIRVELLKRTSGPITSLRAYVDNKTQLLDLLEYEFPPQGKLHEQTLTFGYLPDENYEGRKLTIVVQARMRKGWRAIKKKVAIKSS